MNVKDTGRVAWPVMVLAHNEASHIVACLDSLYKAEPGREFKVFVLANGCTDNTEEIVENYARSHLGVSLIRLDIADKCNAWNVYVHDIIPRQIGGHSFYFFMDGDAQACPNALSELAHALECNPEALAAAAVPFNGRSMHYDRAMIRDNHGLVANLYALRGKFVVDLQQKEVRLPVGLEGDDDLIGALVKWDLDPLQEWIDGRIAPCLNAGFTFESMSWSRTRDWRNYWRRRVRYSRRRYETQLLRGPLKTQGIKGLPVNVSELYRGVDNCKLKWFGVETLFSWLAKKEMRKSLK